MHLHIQAPNYTTARTAVHGKIGTTDSNGHISVTYGPIPSGNEGSYEVYASVSSQTSNTEQFDIISPSVETVFSHFPFIVQTDDYHMYVIDNSTPYSDIYLYYKYNGYDWESFKIGKTDKNGHFSKAYGPIPSGTEGHYEVYVKVAGEASDKLSFDVVKPTEKAGEIILSHFPDTVSINRDMTPQYLHSYHTYTISNAASNADIKLWYRANTGLGWGAWKNIILGKTNSKGYFSAALGPLTESTVASYQVYAEVEDEFSNTIEFDVVMGPSVTFEPSLFHAPETVKVGDYHTYAITNAFYNSNIKLHYRKNGGTWQQSTLGTTNNKGYFSESYGPVSDESIGHYEAYIEVIDKDSNIIEFDIVPSECSDHTPVGKCSSSKPFYCNINGLLVNNCQVCGCPNPWDTCKSDGTCKDFTCLDNGYRLQPNECSPYKPRYCYNTELINNCQVCGCPNPWDTCKSDGTCKDMSCIYDGVRLQSGECSSTLPKYCDNGKITNNCNKCGCPNPWDTCKSDGTCKDFTCIYNNTHFQPNECLPEKPKQCKNKEIIDNCRECKCPSEYHCQANNTCHFCPVEGDVNNNGESDCNDYYCILGVSMGTMTLEECPCSDTDGDGYPGTSNDVSEEFAILYNLGFFCMACWDTTPTGECSSTKPFYCNEDATLVKNCQVCGCPDGEVCQKDGECLPGCKDGTLLGQCSLFYPKRCDIQSRLIIDDCEYCDCPPRQNCEENGTCSLDCTSWEEYNSGWRERSRLVDNECEGNNCPSFSSDTEDVTCAPEVVLVGSPTQEHYPCVLNGQMFLHGAEMFGDEIVFCMNHKWYDLDKSEDFCSIGNWIAGGEENAFGEYDTGDATECCEDDDGEYMITTHYPGTHPVDVTACCDSPTDIVELDGSCTGMSDLDVLYFVITPYPLSTWDIENTNINIYVWVKNQGTESASGFSFTGQMNGIHYSFDYEGELKPGIQKMISVSSELKKEYTQSEFLHVGDDNEVTITIDSENVIEEKNEINNYELRVFEIKSTECTPGQTQSCIAGKGICSDGERECVRGLWGKCESYRSPQAESCNGLDDDCDGQTDEGCDDDNDDYCDEGMTRSSPYSCSGTSNCCHLGGTIATGRLTKIYRHHNRKHVMAMMMITMARQMKDATMTTMTTVTRA